MRDLIRDILGNSLTLADLLGLAITATSIVIAVLAVMIAWGFSRKYDEHVEEIKGLQEHAKRYQSDIDKAIHLNRESLMLMKTTVYHLYRLQNTSLRLERTRYSVNELVKNGVWIDRIIPEQDRAAFAQRGAAEVERLVQENRRIDREVLFLLTDRPNRLTNLNDLVESGDLNTLRLLGELEAIDVDGWNKRQIVRAIAQLEYRLYGTGSRRTYDSASWTGRKDVSGR
jgi:hypothetical protein